MLLIPQASLADGVLTYGDKDVLGTGNYSQDPTTGATLLGLPAGQSHSARHRRFTPILSTRIRQSTRALIRFLLGAIGHSHIMTATLFMEYVGRK